MWSKVFGICWFSTQAEEVDKFISAHFGWGRWPSEKQTFISQCMVEVICNLPFLANIFTSAVLKRSETSFCTPIDQSWGMLCFKQDLSSQVSELPAGVEVWRICFGNYAPLPRKFSRIWVILAVHLCLNWHGNKEFNKLQLQSISQFLS